MWFATKVVIFAVTTLLAIPLIPLVVGFFGVHLVPAADGRPYGCANALAGIVGLAAVALLYFVWWWLLFRVLP